MKIIIKLLHNGEETNQVENAQIRKACPTRSDVQPIRQLLRLRVLRRAHSLNQVLHCRATRLQHQAHARQAELLELQAALEVYEKVVVRPKGSHEVNELSDCAAEGHQ